jgi:hypothetical protein
MNVNDLQLAVAAGHQESKEDREKPLVIWRAKKHKNLQISQLAVCVPSGAHNVVFKYQKIILLESVFGTNCACRICHMKSLSGRCGIEIEVPQNKIIIGLPNASDKNVYFMLRLLYT